MIRHVTALLIGFAAMAVARPASAQLFGPNVPTHATIFAAVVPTPVARPAFGFAFGGGLPGSGFELEFARGKSRLAEDAPALNTFTVNFFADIPLPSPRTRLYGIGGLGLWNEAFGNGRGAGGLGYNIGVGVKIDLAGPLRLRVDYRLFLHDGSPDGEPRYPKTQRVYAGLCFGC